MTDLRERVGQSVKNLGHMPPTLRARQHVAIFARQQTDFYEVMQHD
ncbi:MAG TPA: hypothetical protein VMA74_16570 [Dyella sp.]|nr:hypothetical protein [Dyella sp.]HUB91338.1 hypothetical protein [Dyella sp.]